MAKLPLANMTLFLRYWLGRYGRALHYDFSAFSGSKVVSASNGYMGLRRLA